MTPEAREDGPCTCADVLQNVPCGCGEHEARLYRDQVVHWRGEHWRVGCAFEALLGELDRVEEALAVLAGGPDREGLDHGSHLHDVVKVGRFAEQILEGETVEEALRT